LPGRLLGSRASGGGRGVDGAVEGGVLGGRRRAAVHRYGAHIGGEVLWVMEEWIVNGRGGKGAARVIGDQCCEVGGARAILETLRRRRPSPENSNSRTAALPCLACALVF